MSVNFLSLAEILDIHQDQLERYGGESGIRDLNMLKSAIGMPKATFAGDFLHTDVFEMAGAYLFHICQNHPFVDGNKRTAAVAAIVFLDINGFIVEAAPIEVSEFVKALACGNRKKSDAAVFFQEHSRPEFE